MPGNGIILKFNDMANKTAGATKKGILKSSRKCVNLVISSEYRVG